MAESVLGMTEDVFVDGVGNCINAINGNTNAPNKLPKGMSKRFRVGTDLANAVVALGYRTEVSIPSCLSKLRPRLSLHLHCVPRPAPGEPCKQASLRPQSVLHHFHPGRIQYLSVPK